MQRRRRTFPAMDSVHVSQPFLCVAPGLLKQATGARPFRETRAIRLSARPYKKAGLCRRSRAFPDNTAAS